MILREAVRSVAPPHDRKLGPPKKYFARFDCAPSILATARTATILESCGWTPERLARLRAELNALRDALNQSGGWAGIKKGG
jgi:hypothetical protein